MSGVRRLSDTALVGAGAGAASGYVPLYSAATGKYVAGANVPADNALLATHNITASNLRFSRAAIARLRNNTGDFTIAGQGDSIFDNGGSSSPLNDSIIRYGAKNLATRLGVTARHAVVPFQTANVTRAEWATATGWSSSQNFLGASHQGVTSAVANANAIVFTPMDDSGAQINVDSFTVILHPSSGGFQWAIDGGSYTAQANTASSTGTYNRFTVSAGTRGLHTLSIKAAATGSALFMLAAAGEDSTTRSVRYITGGTSGSACPSTAQDAIRCLAPDLALYNWGTNDEGAQTALATYQTNVQTVAAAPAAWARPADTLWIGWPPRQTPGTPLVEAQYYAALDAAVDAVGVPALHIDRVLGSYAVGNAAPISAYSDGIHLNLTGRQLWGSVVAGLLGSL